MDSAVVGIGGGLSCKQDLRHFVDCHWGGQVRMGDVEEITVNLTVAVGSKSVLASASYNFFSSSAIVDLISQSV
jgi:hypothetical protein